MTFKLLANYLYFVHIAVASWVGFTGNKHPVEESPTHGSFCSESFLFSKAAFHFRVTRIGHASHNFASKFKLINNSVESLVYKRKTDCMSGAMYNVRFSISASDDANGQCWNQLAILVVS